MLTRVLIVVCGLMFSHPGSAEWRAINTKNFGSVLIQKEISANNGDPVVALMCLPEPTFIVEWFDNMANVAVSIDTVQIDVLMQFTLRNGMQYLTLKSGHIQALIKGFKMQLEATLSSSEKVTAETSLVGFSSEFKEADMDCLI